MKLSEYENPINGKEHNLFRLSDLWGQFLGIFVLLIIFMFGLKMEKYVFPEPVSTATNPVTTTRIIL
jgi:hypothetical protein